MTGLEKQVVDTIAQNRNVSRETMTRLSIIVSQLEKWQPRINLVAPSTMNQIWSRHILDSLQLVDIPQCRDALREDVQWLDLGSGGGFPGLVIAAALAEKRGSGMTLIESNAKKCAFLRETSRIAELPVTVINERIDVAIPTLSKHYDFVSARALAPLVTLLDMTSALIEKGTFGIFPKGQDVDDELKAASISWNLGYDLIDSQTEAAAKVIVIKFVSRRF